MTQTQPPVLSQQDIIDAINAAGSSAGSPGIGLVKGEKPVGLQTTTGGGHPGMAYVPQPGTKFGTPIRTQATQWGGAIYQPGDEDKPGGGTADQVMTLQEDLIQAGLLNTTDVRPGIWDAKSANAYKIVLAFANNYGMNAADAMTQLLQNPQVQQRRQVAPGQITNPTDIAAQVSGAPVGSQDTAQQMLGMDLPAGEVKDFVKQYQAQEIAARKAYAAADLKNDPTYQGAPSVADAAQQYIKEHNLQQAVSYGTAARMFDFFGMLKGPV